MQGLPEILLMHFTAFSQRTLAHVPASSSQPFMYARPPRLQPFSALCNPLTTSPLPSCGLASQPTGCTSARQLQQGQPQQPGQVDLGGVFNQIGQVAQQGIQSFVNNNQQGQPAQQGNASRPLASLGDTLQNLGASLNNRTAGGRPAAPDAAAAPPPNDGLLADPDDITTAQNATAAGGALGSLLGNLTSGLAGAVGGQQQEQQTKKDEPIQPPPGTKSSAQAAGSSAFVVMATAALLVVQLLA